MPLETNGNGRFYIDAAMKAAQWERAKGELRALVAIQGSYGGGNDRWETLQGRINEFIQQVEDDALQE